MHRGKTWADAVERRLLCSSVVAGIGVVAAAAAALVLPVHGRAMICKWGRWIKEACGG